MADEPEASPHDALFKAAFTRLDNAAGLIRSVLGPTLSDEIDWETLERRPGSFVDERLAQRHSDLLFGVQLGGREVLVYVLVEHQSTPDPSMPWRMWLYVTRIWAREAEGDRLPLVIPIVVYHGRRRWNAPRDIEAMIERGDLGALDLALPVPSLRYLLDDLRAHTPAALRARALPAFGALALWALRAAADRSFADTMDVFGGLFRTLLAEDGPEALATLLRYLSVVAGDREPEVVERVIERLEPPIREEAMSYYDRLIREGREVGLAEGRRAILLAQVQLKFGEPSDDTLERIRRATVEQLDEMAGRILTAESIDELLEG